MNSLIFVGSGNIGAAVAWDLVDATVSRGSFTGHLLMS
jgi:hypothetical protein